MWFAGVHANVGGGYPDDALAFVALDWIMDQAAKNGLVFDPQKYRENSWRDLWRAQNARGRRYDSRKGVAGYYRYGPRKIAALSKENIGTPDEVIIDLPKIHESAFIRMKTGADAYAPIGFPSEYAIVDNSGNILSGTSNPYEHPTQAISRVHQQEQAWNWVWLKRIIYFATVAASLYLAAFPLIYAKPDGDACTNAFCPLTTVIDFAANFLPGFVSPWIASFKANPDWFALGLGLIIFFILAGVWCGLKITDTMRPLWVRTLASPPRPVTPAPPPTDLIYRIRSNRYYQQFIRFMKRSALPNIFALLFLIVILAVVSRISFAVGNSAGMFCHGGTLNQDFSTNQLCWASGYRAVQGQSYRITLKMTSPWRDKDISSSLLGFELRSLP